jgi:hypothetical protein
VRPGELFELRQFLGFTWHVISALVFETLQVQMYMYRLCDNEECDFVFRRDFRDCTACPRCEKPRTDPGRVMYYLPVRDWLQNLCNDDTLAAALSWGVGRKRNDSTISDVCDTPMWERFVSDEQMQKDPETAIALSCSVDGVSPFKRSKYSFWPIAGSIASWASG